LGEGRLGIVEGEYGNQGKKMKVGGVGGWKEWGQGEEVRIRCEERR